MAESSTRSESRSANNKQNSDESSTTHACNVCKESFKTRNKLFEHIKEQGHALRVENTNEQGSAKKGRKKKGKKKH